MILMQALGAESVPLSSLRSTGSMNRTSIDFKAIFEAILMENAD